MAKATHSDMIYASLSKIKKGTCAEIAVHCRLTYIDVEKKIYKLIEKGKVRVLLTKGGYSPQGKGANVYFIPTQKEEKSVQNELF